MKIERLKKLLLYKNIKILILIFYPIFSIFIYFNWNYITFKWNYGLKLIQENPNEFINWIMTLYYCFFTIYIIFISISPIMIFDKKFESTDKISLELFKLNEKNIFKMLKNILIYISFPLISIAGIFIWLAIDMTSTFLGSLFAIIMILFIPFLILTYKLKNIFNYLKRILKEKK